MTPSVAIARRLAAEQPESALPCPLCASIVNAPNLAGHLDKVHRADASAAAAPEDAASTFVGLDGRTEVLVGVAAALFVVAGVALLPFVSVPLGPLPLSLGLVAALPITLLVVLQYNDKLRASLVVEGARVTLSGVLGTRVGERVLTLPAELETGRRVERRPAPPGLPHAENEAIDHDAGSYLRLRRGDACITLMADKAPGLAHAWRAEGFTRGPAARRHDLRLTATQLVQLTYHLAALGQLQPKPAKGKAQAPRS